MQLPGTCSFITQTTGLSLQYNVSPQQSQVCPTPGYSGWYHGEEMMLPQNPSDISGTLWRWKTDRKVFWLGTASGTRICTSSMEKYTQLSRLSELSGGKANRIWSAPCISIDVGGKITPTKEHDTPRVATFSLDSILIQTWNIYTCSFVELFHVGWFRIYSGHDPSIDTAQSS